MGELEIYNHGCEHDGLYGFNPQSYDEMLRTGQRIYTVATDDNHNSFPFDSPLCDSFGGFTMVKAEKLEYGAVMEALEKGDFYFSMGPEIKEAYIRDRKLVVKTSPVEKNSSLSRKGGIVIRSWPAKARPLRRRNLSYPEGKAISVWRSVMERVCTRARALTGWMKYPPAR